MSSIRDSNEYFNDFAVAFLVSLAACFLTYPIFALSGEFGFIEGIVPLAVTFVVSKFILAGFSKYLSRKSLMWSAIAGIVIGMFLMVVPALNLFSNLSVDNLNLWIRIVMMGQACGVVIVVLISLVVVYLDANQDARKYRLAKMISTTFYYIAIFAVAGISTIFWIVVLHPIIG
jgi:hypothetical protein